MVPVLRALIGAKRRDVQDYDRVQDGARAVLIEESLVAFIFHHFESYGFASKELGWDILSIYETLFEALK